MTRKVWAGYASAIWAAVFAAVSLYWALGGMVGLDTVGGEIEEMARNGDPTADMLAWGAALVKIAGVVFALALVQRWGRIFPRPLMLVAGWLGVAVLIGYGGLTVGAELLVLTGAIAEPPNLDRYAFMWHLLVWDPYFLIWGILLAIAMRQYAVTPAALESSRQGG